MSDDMDAKLARVFAESFEQPCDEAFTARVLQAVAVSRQVQRLNTLGLVLGIALLVIAASAPVMEISATAVQGASLLSLHVGAFLVSPAGATLAVALGLLASLWARLYAEG